MKQHFSKGDRVVKGSEVGVIQMRQNWSTKRWFPVVVIVSGPRTGQSEYPNKGWTVEESATYEDRPDYDEDSVTTTENKAVRLWRERHNR